MEEEGWQRRWKNWVKPSRFPGVWKVKSGGHLVRARVMDPTTGHLKEIKRVLHDTDDMAALQWLESERQRIRAGTVRDQPQSVRFADYAVDLFEKKKRPGGKIKSAAGRTRWKSTLEHLIAGTVGTKSGMRVAGFGEMFVERIHVTHVEAWQLEIASLIAAGDYAPTTANGWLSVLRVIMRQAKRDFALDHLATDGVDNFDESEHATYSEEEPNALPAERVGEFLEKLRELYPQHYAMTYLGLVTGLRPSSLRPLRRNGPKPDIQWDNNRMLVRRSQTRGPEVMNTTKQKRRYGIDLPPDVMDVLRWHVDTQLETTEQQESDLLFPSITGGFRGPNVLNKPFAAVAEEIELGYPFTQRGMRRTFNDLARHARVEAIVTRSISGHLTERMQDHYSTVAADEQRASIAKVVSLFGHKNAQGAEGNDRSGGALSGAPEPPGGAPSKKPAR